MTAHAIVDNRRSVVLPIFFVCLGYALFNIGDAALKFAADRFGPAQVVFLSSLAGVAGMSAYGLWAEGKRAFVTRKPFWMLARALLLVTTSVCNVLALPHLSLAAFYTLAFTSPLMVALLSDYFFDDRPNPTRLGVILFGLAVVALVFRPGGALFSPWALLALLSAFAYAVQVIVIRHIGPDESRIFLSWSGSALCAVLSVPFFLGDFIVPTLPEWGLFALMGLAGSAGLVCVSYGVQTASAASLVAPYHYTQIVWGALIGYFVFNERPTAEIMIGAVLIILSGLYLMRSEMRREH